MAVRRPRSPDADALLRTVGIVHAAGLDSALWPNALRALTDIFGAVGASLEIFDKRPMRLTEFCISGIPDGAEEPYVEYYSQHNPRAAYAMRHLSQKILFDYRIIDERGMDRDPYYADYLRPNDLRYFITGQIVDTREKHGVISIQRSKGQGHAEKLELAMMKRLLPHMSQAYDVSARLRKAGAGLFEGALDWLADGAALVTSDGSVLFANLALRTIFRRSDGIRCVRGALELEPDATRRLGSALAAVGRLRDGDLLSGGGTDFVVARGATVPPYHVAVRPILHPDRIALGRRRVAAIVFVRDPLRENAAKAGALRDAYRLTEAEADIALALQAGTSLVEYARTRGVSSNTVYTHLRRIKEKTNSGRQAELIRKLNDFSLPLRED